MTVLSITHQVIKGWTFADCSHASLNEDWNFRVVAFSTKVAVDSVREVSPLRFLFVFLVIYILAGAFG